MITHQPQLDWWLNGEPVRNLCGSTNGAYDVEFATGRLLTPLQVAVETGNADNTFTSFGELEAIVTHFGVTELVRGYYGAGTINWLRSVLEAGGIANMLIDYRQIRNKAPAGLTYRYAHFITVVDIEGSTVWLHDPLRRNGPTDEPLASFTAAINTPSLYIGWVKDSKHPKGGYYADLENRANQGLGVKRAIAPAPTPSVFERILPRAVAIRETVYGAVA